MTRRRRTGGWCRAVASVALAACLWPVPGTAGPAEAARLVAEAKEALDTHYGRASQLDRAARLLARAIAEDDRSAGVYVQAARLTVKGGHVVSTQFRTGTMDAYGELLDRALALEPTNAKALILKGEYHFHKRDKAAALAALDRARATGTTDAWLHVGYGRIHRTDGDVEKASAAYDKARAAGPGTTSEQRNAHVAALDGLATIAAWKDDEVELRKLTTQIRAGRDPRDAWALGNQAALLGWTGRFDDAIALGREALATMNYGAARVTLAAALFGKAAEHTLAGRSAAAQSLLAEARGFGHDRATLFGSWNPHAPRVRAVLPTLETLVD